MPASRGHRRSDRDVCSAVVSPPHRDRRMRCAEVVDAPQDVQRGLDGLPGSSESHGSASGAGGEQADGEVHPLHRRRVQQIVWHMAVHRIHPHLLQFHAISGLLHNAMVEIRKRHSARTSRTAASAVPGHETAESAEEDGQIRTVAVGDEIRDMPVPQLVQLGIDETRSHLQPASVS